MKILFIGTGVMGSPMARHLAESGQDVTVYNRTRSKAEKLAPLCKVSTNLIEAVKDKDIVFSIVGYPKDVKSIYQTMLPHAKRGSIFIDMTTSSPSLAKELYLIAKEKGISMLDAPVTGGDLGAINGTLSIMVGGDEDIFKQVLPLLELMGTTITYMGSPGNGQLMKLSNQIVIASNILGIAEGLAFANEHSLDLMEVYKVITGGSANSWQAAVNGKKMILKDYEPGFFIKHFLKDLQLAIESTKQDLPLLKQAKKAYTLLGELYADKGTQAIIDFYIKESQYQL